MSLCSVLCSLNPIKPAKSMYSGGREELKLQIAMSGCWQADSKSNNASYLPFPPLALGCVSVRLPVGTLFAF